jgi:hypothetical protein
LASPEQPHALGYATPRRSRRRWVHRGYLLLSLVSFALAATSWLVAGRNAGALLPMPDPPPANDARDGRWFLAGACAMPVFALLGLLFLFGTFAARPRDAGATAAE